MPRKFTDESNEKCSAEVELASEFPEPYAFYASHPHRPERAEIWERVLRVARNSRPILEDLRARGLDLIRVEHYTPPGTDRRPLYETVLNWLPRIQDPLTLAICLMRLMEPGALALVKKNRGLLLSLTREWTDRLRHNDRELTLAVLSQCLMMVVLERDLPEVLDWVKDSRLSIEVRASYVFGLQRFARKPGLARDTIVALVNDRDVGRTAVWALAGALKAEALPLLRGIQESSPHQSVRETAAAAAKKIEARLRRVDLPDASRAMLPQGYASTSIEFDTDCVPELMSILESQLNGRLQPGVAEQLALSANQLKRGRRRFHIVPFTLPDGVVTQFGFALYAEDEDVTVLEIHFDAMLRDAVGAALRRLMDGDSANRE